jgi:zinc protease
MIRGTLLLAGLFLIGGTAAAQERLLDVPYTRFVLPNGLNVILHQDRTTPMVSVNLWYNVGSGREKPGRTGFAHLFEHILFEWSANVPEGMFDQWLEAAGGSNNGSTNSDRTNYFEDIPSNALELALFLESDRMGHLLGAMSPDKVDGQRDVVKNERRQSYENRPYGMASLTLDSAMYPPSHPYSWPTIGSMEDLSAASYEDVVQFFQVYYAPNNASLSIAGDLDIAETRRMVEHWFADVPAGKPVPPIARPPRSSPSRSEWCSRTGCSCRACTRAGSPRPATHPATRRWTWWRACSPAARTRGSTSGSYTTCRSRRTWGRSRGRRRSHPSSASPRPRARATA